ncbi:hypothetical protein THAOC_08114 [Thalassiosira oceanica]|uniref:Uncharacterized protein n=1 Tax=Thalassiosira oceanica TaxID=159749 RepID=K0TIW9_THAOC|nr:hypothetical protein THAOC_08114 [Thalassiosira oceanica]|eukprot:EJK70517.1 hypothetical protein THAOC_08114 [Thalassiosira oceanica]
MKSPSSADLCEEQDVEIELLLVPRANNVATPAPKTGKQFRLAPRPRPQQNEKSSVIPKQIKLAPRPEQYQNSFVPPCTLKLGVPSKQRASTLHSSSITDMRDFNFESLDIGGIVDCPNFGTEDLDLDNPSTPQQSANVKTLTSPPPPPRGGT